MLEADILIRNGYLFDGSGKQPYYGDLAVSGDSILSLAPNLDIKSKRIIDADGKAVAPGFINMLSWACDTLIADGRSQSDIRQGVTLEIMGEGFSYGPINDRMKSELIRQQGDIQYDIEWTTLDEYLCFLKNRGISTNIASFVGAGTLRAFVTGYEDREATDSEIHEMELLLQQAMIEGAIGLSSALIYVPDCFYREKELIQLAQICAKYDGLYISHIRNEADRLVEAVDELINLVKQTGVKGEIYHLKAAGRNNWNKIDDVIDRVQKAQNEGFMITADMYTYPAAATGLDASMPHWVQVGGHQEWVTRLKNPEIRERLRTEMMTSSPDWESAYLNAGSMENVLFVEFKNPALKHLAGKTLAEIVEIRGSSAEDTMIDLVIEDDSRIGTIYFSMSDENLRKQIRLPWMSFCSDAGSMAPEGIFLNSSTHPRAYGSFARLLGRYVRDEGLITLQEAIRRLTSLPAKNAGLSKRGSLKPGYYADIVIFDPQTIQDHATFINPHQYATGVQQVLVNGKFVLEDGDHTGATPGCVIYGPGRSN